jgi:hypothetical protein
VGRRIAVEVEHALAIEDAIARIEALAEFYRNKYRAEVTWNGRTADLVVRYLGIRIEVVVRVEPRRVTCDASDPGFLLRGQGTKYLRAKLERFLDPGNALADLPRR